MTIARTAVAALLCLASPAASFAADDNGGSQQTIPSDVSRQSGTLSDKLNATDGVVHPEGTVDPEMAKQAPATGTMPVIPPAGSPGAAPGVQPK